MAKEEAASLDQVVEDTNESNRKTAVIRRNFKNLSSFEDSVSHLSDAVIVRHFAWKILIQKRKTEANGLTFGFYLECNPETEGTDWSCYAKADLTLINQTTGLKFSRKIDHMFFSGEKDWGYSNFLNWSDVVDPAKGYIKDDSVICEVVVEADAEFDVNSCSNVKKDIVFIEIDFELDNWKTRKGATLSPSTRFGKFWWRFRIEIVDKMLAVSLVCEGLKSHGGCSSQWSCVVTGNVALVNQLDDNKNRVERFANMEMSNKAQSMFISDMIKVDPFSDQDKCFVKNGSIIFKARVVASRFLIVNSSRYAEMLGRRNSKEKNGGGIAKVDENVAMQSKQKKKKSSCKKKPKQFKWVDSLQTFWDRALAFKYPRTRIDYSVQDPEDEEGVVVECSIGKLVVVGAGSTKELARENAAQSMVSLIEDILESENAAKILTKKLGGEDSKVATLGCDSVNHPPLKDETAAEKIVSIPNKQSIVHINEKDIKRYNLDLNKSLDKIALNSESKQYNPMKLADNQSLIALPLDGVLTGDLEENQETDSFLAKLENGLTAGLQADTIIDNVDDTESKQVEQDHSSETSQCIGKERRRKPSGACCLPSCTGLGLHRCSRCLSVSYCSQLCSDQNWGEHREQCKDYRERDREAGVD